MRLLAFLLFVFSVPALAQVTITGVVKDSKSGLPLPFSTIYTPDGNRTIADVDGKFILENAGRHDHFVAAYVGYLPKKVNINLNQVYYSVGLAPQTEELEALVITTGNPAPRIIREAIRRRDENDALRKLSSFEYKSYDRLIVTANPDSIAGKLDSVFVYEKTGRRFEKIDSTDYKFKKLIEKRHLYQTEKVSEFKYNKEQGLKENVLATRMAGFKNPLYEFISLKLQPYSLYEDIDLVESKYSGPLSSENAPYRYAVLDTVTINGRSAYMIFFTPKREKKKYRLEGVLYIDTENYGIAQAVLRVKNVLDITSTHYYSYEKEQKLWFPDKRTLKNCKRQ